MVKHIAKSELKTMSLKELRKHAKKLQKTGYIIPGNYKSLDKKPLYRIIAQSQKVGLPPLSSSEGESDVEFGEIVVEKEVSGCALPGGMSSPWACKKKFSVGDVRELADSCGIEYTNKVNTCKQLVNLGVIDEADVPPPSPKKRRKKSRRKAVSPKRRRKKAKTPSASPKGAKTKAELMKLLKVELIALTKKAKLPYSSRNKGELADQLLLHRKGKASPKKKKSVSPKRRKSVSPKKKKKKKKPVVVEEESVSVEEEEVITPRRSCGSYDYEDLISKRLEELRGILREKGIGVSVGSKEEAADYICANEEFGSCNVVDDFSCPSGSRCEIDPALDGSGYCLSEDLDRPAELNYQGKTIVGSVEAITALRRKLGISKSGSPKSLKASTLAERQRLIATAVQISGRDESVFANWNRGKLKMFMQQQPIFEERSKTALVAELADLTGKPKSKYQSYSVEKLQRHLTKRRAKKAAEYEPADQPVGLTSRDDAQKLNKGQLAKLIVSLSPRHKSAKSLKKKYNKEQLVDMALEAAGVGVEEEEVDDISSEGVSSAELGEDETVEEVIEVRRPKRPKPVVALEEEDVLTSEEEEEEVVSSEAEEDINVQDVEQALGEVMTGKASQIENLTQAQNAVLKCLGLAM